MGQKVDPRGLRIGINKTWQSVWYGEKDSYKENLRQDILIIEEIKKRHKNAAISKVGIERNVGKVRIVIHTGRPGVLIGRGGSGIEELKKLIQKKFFFRKKLQVQLDVKEVKSIEENAQLLADDIAFQLEKRVPFRRVMKGMLDKIMQNRKIQGAKIEIAGRLGGAEMSRREWLSRGKLPLHTLRANIDFAKSTAFTTYGVIGVKVWIYKGEEEEKDYFKKGNPR